MVVSRGQVNKKPFSLHRLVDHYFIGPRPRKKQTNHKDGVKINCCVSNLEYVTDSENKRHAMKIGLWDHRLERKRETIARKRAKLLAARK